VDATEIARFATTRIVVRPRNRCFNSGGDAMSPILKTQKSRDGVITAVGVVVLLLGAATGDARVMLALALIGLAVIGIVDRQRIGRGWMPWLLAAAVAAAIVFAIR
jgi:hypothetical protein